MEQWKVISGYEKYEVSDHGNVRNRNTKHQLQEQIYRDGYSTVLLYDFESNTRRLKIHRLVSLAFIGEPPDDEKVQVNHIDGNKQNNHYLNLEWCSPVENIDHAIQNGLCTDRKGVLNPTAKLTDADVLMIRKLYVKRDSVFGTVGLATRFSVSPSVISDIINRKKWKHL